MYKGNNERKREIFIKERMRERDEYNSVKRDKGMDRRIESDNLLFHGEGNDDIILLGFRY